MSQLEFPLQFKRQYAGPLDADAIFATSTDRINFLSNPLCYAGMMIYDLEQDQPFWVNAAKDGFVHKGHVQGNLSATGEIYSSFRVRANKGFYSEYVGPFYVSSVNTRDVSTEPFQTAILSVMFTGSNREAQATFIINSLGYNTPATYNRLAHQTYSNEGSINCATVGTPGNFTGGNGCKVRLTIDPAGVNVTCNYTLLYLRPM